jgi:hypothetical protein
LLITNEGEDGLGYDKESKAVIKLNNSMVLYLREVNRYLALVCLLRESNFDKHGLIDYNFQVITRGCPKINCGKFSTIFSLLPSPIPFLRSVLTMVSQCFKKAIEEVFARRSKKDQRKKELKL